MYHRSHDGASSRCRLELDDGDRARLAVLAAGLRPELPGIADRFYAQLGIPDGARAELCDALILWLEAGLAGTHDGIAVRRAVVTRHHAARGLPSLLGAMNTIRCGCHDAIDALVPADETRVTARSLDKLLDRELAALSDAAAAECLRLAAAERVSALQSWSTALAHELRNPINAARLNLEVVERRTCRDGDGDPKVAEAVSAIDEELARLTRLLNEFLAFARPTKLAIDERDVGDLIRRVLASEQAVAIGRGARLAAVDSGPVVASVDANKLLQVVQNLVRNALEACNEGGNVVVAARGDEDRVYVAVEDDGAGIPDDVRHRIFEPFFTTKHSGTGLGLAIVHSLVTQHGGTVDVRPLGRGTRFEITLPRRSPLSP